MITRIEALNYRCLRYVAQDIGPFHVLVGPNASGKSTFLDVAALLRDVTRDGLEAAIDRRAPNYMDLFWQGQASRFELAVEAEIPEEVRDALPGTKMVTCRYELAVGTNGDLSQLGILTENVWLQPPKTHGASPQEQGQACSAVPDTILTDPRTTDWTCVLSKLVDRSRGEAGFVDLYISETSGETLEFALGPQRSALAGLPADPERFPVATWFRRCVTEAIQTVALDARAMRRASPPVARGSTVANGTGLPWILDKFLNGPDDDMVQRWLEHVRIALPDVRAIDTIERPEDKHRYVRLTYENGLVVPSWLVSDGTLRFLALTLLPYLPGMQGIYLIEEPENGIHPTAIELVLQSLSSVYDGQVLVATHSPAVVGLVRPDEVLCFTMSAEGGAEVIPGNRHPKLKHWRGEVDLGVLFGGGVLG